MKEPRVPHGYADNDNDEDGPLIEELYRTLETKGLGIRLRYLISLRLVFLLGYAGYPEQRIISVAARIDKEERVLKRKDSFLKDKLTPNQYNEMIKLSKENDRKREITGPGCGD